MPTTPTIDVSALVSQIGAAVTPINSLGMAALGITVCIFVLRSLRRSV